MSVTANEQRTLEHEESHVIEVTADEYHEAIDRALKHLELTWEQLQAQARRGDFSSRDARALWAAVGHFGEQS